MYDDYTDHDDYTQESDTLNDNADDWYEGPQPRARRNIGIDPKVWIGLLVVILVTAGGVGAYYLVRNQFGIQNTPDGTTRRFYEALNRRDFGTAATYIDPTDNVTYALFTNTENLANIILQFMVDTTAEEFNLEIPDFVMDLFADLEWEFREMSYTTIEQSGDQARVEVNGVLHLSVLGFEAPAPWSIIHELVFIDGEWYIRFGL